MQIPENKMTESLYKALAKIDTPENIKLFLEDLCTINEIMDMAQRLETARLLSEGKNYKEVSAQTGASSATVSRVNRCLKYGDGGYKQVLNMEDQR